MGISTDITDIDFGDCCLDERYYADDGVADLPDQDNDPNYARKSIREEDVYVPPVVVAPPKPRNKPKPKSSPVVSPPATPAVRDVVLPVVEDSAPAPAALSVVDETVSTPNTESQESSWWDYADNVATGILIGGAVLGAGVLLAPAAGALLVGAGLAGAGAFVTGAGAAASTVVFSAAGAGAMTAAGVYMTARTAPQALEAGERLVTQDYNQENPNITPTQDALNVASWSAGAVGSAFGVSAWAQGANTLAKNISLYQTAGMGTKAVGEALKDADAVRRFMSSTQYATEMATHPRFAGTLASSHAQLAKVWDPASKALVGIEGARLGGMGYDVASNENSDVTWGQMLMAGGMVALGTLGHLQPWVMKRAANLGMNSQTGARPAVNGEFTEAEILADSLRHAAGEESLAVERARRSIGTLPEEHPELPSDASTHDKQVAALDSKRYLPTQEEHRAGVERTLTGNDEMHARAREALDSGELTTVDGATEGRRLPNPLATPVARTPQTNAAQGMKSYLQVQGYKNFEELLAKEPDVALNFLNEQFTPDDLIWAFDPKNGINGNRLMRAESQVDALVRDPDFANNSIYTRNTEADVAHYRQVAREADKMWDEGRPVYFEVDGQKETVTGLLIGSKDLVVTSVPKPGSGKNGFTTMGSMGPGMASDEVSFFSRRVGELGAIEVPVGAVTAGNGGTAKDVRGRYIANPSPAEEQFVTIDGLSYQGTDIGGSSSPTVYVIKSRTSPVKISSGSDTGGSIHAPVSLVSGVGSYIPPVDGIPRQGVVHYSLTDDHLGIMAPDSDTAYRVAQGISATAAAPAPKLTPNRPRVAYVKQDFDAQEPEVRASLYGQVAELHDQGFQVVALDHDLHGNIIGDFQGSIYGPKTRAQVLWTLMNPKQNAGSWIPNWLPARLQTGIRNLLEPPRVGIRLDENLEVRVRKAQEEYPFYPRVMAQDARNNGLIDEILGEGTVLLRAQPQRVPTALLMDRDPALNLVGASPRRRHLVDSGDVGGMLDKHDYETMVFDSMRGWAGRVDAAEPGSIGRGFLVFGKPDDVHTFDQLEKAYHQGLLAEPPHHPVFSPASPVVAAPEGAAVGAN